MWVEQKWKDEFLKWKPEQYGDMDSIVIPYDKVWLPDTYLYNRCLGIRCITTDYCIYTVLPVVA